MNMRDIINLLEAKKIEIDLGGDDLPFYVTQNPSAAQMQLLRADRLRGIVDDAGDFYVWDAYKGTHADVTNALGVHTRQGLDISDRGVRATWGMYENELLKNKNYRRAFANNPPPFIDADPDDEIEEDAAAPSAFQRWFAGSKIVDADGNPLKLYHGTSKDQDFKSFKVPKNGVWFTNDPTSASEYAMDNDSKNTKYDSFTRTFHDVHSASRVIPCYVRAVNPVYMDAWPDEINVSNYRRAQAIYFDKLRMQGHDAIIFKGGAVVVVLGSPSQIKSAIGNQTFNPDKKNIDESEGDLPQSVADAAEALYAKVKGRPDQVGDSQAVDGYWIETHTLGCRREGGDREDQYWDKFWEYYDQYKNDGVSVVLGDPEDGTFVSITPQRREVTEAATPTLTRQALTHAIIGLGKQYIKDGRARTLYQINNGLCEDFAGDIESLFGHPESLIGIWADGLTVDGQGYEWDVPLIQKHWPKCHPTHGLTWKDVLDEIPAHAWLVFENRHYDAECPQGVDNFFELPLLRRGMAKIARKRSKKPVREDYGPDKYLYWIKADGSAVECSTHEETAAKELGLKIVNLSSFDASNQAAALGWIRVAGYGSELGADIGHAGVAALTGLKRLIWKLPPAETYYIGSEECPDRRSALVAVNRLIAARAG